MGHRGLTWFGKPDASKVDVKYLDSLHIARGNVEDHLKYGNRSEGYEGVVGVKGSGKTNLRKHVEAFDSSDIFNLDGEHARTNIQADATDDPPGVIKDRVSMTLLHAFADKLGQGDSKGKRALRTAYERSVGVLQKLPAALELGGSAVGVKLSLEKLLESAPDDVVHSEVGTLLDEIVKALTIGRKRGYILIDDVEVVFKGIERNPVYLEGILQSLQDINLAGGNRLHALIFIKHGLWRAAFDVQQEYDKVKDGLVFLSWDGGSLVDLIARRIADRREVDPTQDTEALWSRDFEWHGDFNKFTREIASYCVNGPRDMIDLCNKAGHAAGDSQSPITIDHIHGCLAKYSDEKVAGLNADYGRVYVGIPAFVRRVFQDTHSPFMNGKELASKINDKVLINKAAQADNRIGDDLRAGTKEELARLMYEIGVVGIGVEPSVAYAIGSPDVGGSDIVAQEHVVVNPAFRPQLVVPIT
jgi:hypothetical protein